MDQSEKFITNDDLYKFKYDIAPDAKNKFTKLKDLETGEIIATFSSESLAIEFLNAWNTVQGVW